MFLKSIKFLVLMFVLIILSACGKSTEQEVKDAVLSANILLSSSQCQAAIDLLEAIGNQPRSAQYLKTYASAYACRAGYSAITYFGSDIAKTATPSPLGGVSIYSTSLVAVTNPLANDTNFKDLQRAINILLYSGGIETSTDPKTTERAKYFSANEAGDINTQLAFMMMAQLGKMFKVYANTNIAGVKGGAGGSKCFTNYSGTPPLVQAYVGTLPGACKTVADSHPQLDLLASNRKARLCQGVVLMNSILDVLPVVLASAAGGSLSDIATVTTSINTQKAALLLKFPTIGATLTVMSQSNCESDAGITEGTLASYFAIMFEGLIE